MSYIQYIKDHSEEEYWKDVLSSSYFTLDHKLELLKSLEAKN